MPLVTYSDSDIEDDSDSSSHSDVEKPKSLSLAATKLSSTKPSFQKVVDSSNPRRIRVNLTNPADDSTGEGTNSEQRPMKRPKLGGPGLFSGLASFLPVPKHNNSSAPAVKSNNMSLKTGLTPAFARPSSKDSSEVEPAVKAPEIATVIDAEDVQLVGKVTMFKPLSVVRNNQKKTKKKVTTATKASADGGVVLPRSTSSLHEADKEAQAPRLKPKVSLFSITSEDTTVTPINASESKVDYDEEYQESSDMVEFQSISHDFQALSSKPDPQTLDTVASDLKLDDATRRKLFGRKKRGDGNEINLLNFNLDNEYAANEEIRANGETVQHNPLRAIQPGRHNIRQLVNAAVTQKDALEEAWAAGKRNQKEASSRYGWK